MRIFSRSINTMRTTIMIDDKLMTDALKLTGFEPSGRLWNLGSGRC